MVQYCNAYSMAADVSSSEVILLMRQNIPEIDETGKVASVSSEVLASYALRKDIALSLAHGLIELLERDEKD